MSVTRWVRLELGWCQVRPAKLVRNAETAGLLSAKGRSYGETRKKDVIAGKMETEGGSTLWGMYWMGSGNSNAVTFWRPRRV